MDKARHWEDVYQTKSPLEVSWYEPDPQQSVDLIVTTGCSRGRIIDVGGGQSFLVDRLIDAGFEKVAVLDISKSAIDATRARLGDRADRVDWIGADITQTDALGTFDIWHDRAVFHFITDADDRRKYLDLLERTLPIGGHFVIGTFAIGGPEKCSGLPIQQYDAATMKETLGPAFESVKCCQHEHTTPAGKTQLFFYGVYRRVM